MSEPARVLLDASAVLAWVLDQSGSTVIDRLFRYP